MNKLVVGGILVRWLLLLHEFDITIVGNPRKANVVVDFLSILPTQQIEGVFGYSFLDERLFHLIFYTPWFANISNHLVAG